MKKLTKEELILVNGGKVSAALINSILRGASFLLELGRSVGTAIKRIKIGKSCSV